MRKSVPFFEIVQSMTTDLQKKVLALFCLLLLLVRVTLWPVRAVSADSILRAPAVAVPPTLFGMHIHRFATTTPWPPVHFGSWRLWDAQVGWPQLESERNRWTFSTLDNYVDAAEQHGVEIILPLGPTPAWASSRPEEKSAYRPGNAAPPADLEDWREYVRAIGTRYKGRIHEYEIWNEPNLKEFYSGSISEMLNMARIAYATLKEVDPSVVVCSPSATGTQGMPWLDMYLQAGGGKYADVIGYHFYVTPNPPEKMLPLIQQVQALMQRRGVDKKPLWNTETGWAIENHQSVVELSGGTNFNKIVLPTEQASAYLVRAFIVSWAAGVSRFYWYSWDNSSMGLTEKDGVSVKQPGNAYGTLQEWLSGTQMGSCRSNESATWTCDIARGGYKAWIVWNPERPLDFAVPGDWKVTRVRTLFSGVQSISADHHIQIGQMPVLIERVAP
jgi:Glycosyl hydrolases family 39